MAAKGKEVAKKDEPKNEVVELKDGQFIPSIAMATAAELEELKGVEGAGVSDNVDDRGVPLLKIVQKSSPQLDKKKDEKYIPGAEFGDVFNNITKALFKAEAEPLIILPCFFRMVYKQWTPLDDGGGFKGSHPRDTALLRQARPFVHPETKKERRDIFVLPNGDELHLTADYYCLLESTWQPIIIPMSSTNLGASRTLQTLLSEIKIQAGNQIVTQPAFWSRVALKTVYKDDGTYQWYQYSPELLGANESPALRALCKEFALAAKKNEVKIAEDQPDAGGNASVVDGDIPV